MPWPFPLEGDPFQRGKGKPAAAAVGCGVLFRVKYVPRPGSDRTADRSDPKLDAVGRVGHAPGWKNGPRAKVREGTQRNGRGFVGRLGQAPKQIDQSSARRLSPGALQPRADRVAFPTRPYQMTDHRSQITDYRLAITLLHHRWKP